MDDEESILNHEAARLTRKVGMYVAPKWYDIGYWGRYANEPRPPEDGGNEQYGWDFCDH